ncbi:tRNA (cytosine(38)-C(5))-methyltransferase [Eupeodes corollae]|uniref:tRNA (cytosine(38)-C(5))-methyltransferase n=1 Tax=Eupeodes corollae TaxID=290404 RepID=UPI00248FFC05|nr:tRNA (cytosine(38)-C(5))-methyltransferase [Eupeodes corollae]
MTEFKVLELFSGIGGMHSAFLYSKLRGQIHAAMDINTVANTVYAFNHPKVRLLNNNIEKLTPKFIHGLDVNMILMSPPCQPFTRVGNQKDIDDVRTDALTHISEILPELQSIEYILMENVKGFETSKARNAYLEALKRSGFFFREFILSPSQFGVPNTRHRYYCLAKKSDFNFPGKQIHETFHGELFKQLPQRSFIVNDVIETESAVNEDLLLDDKVLKRRIGLFDIASPNSTNTICFTKAYTHYSEGTGSIFSPLSSKEMVEIFERAKSLDPLSDDYIECIRSLKLRYFSPREVARLMSFPEDFQFPEVTTLRQKYRLLGNSINVLVVGELIKLLCS